MMNVKIIQQRLDSYQCKSQQEEVFALKEITQELVLNSLYNAGFFKKAAFHGGTCLRILYGLNRFSEDLDFALLAPDSNFDLNRYVGPLSDELGAYGYEVRIKTKESAGVVQNLFLKSDSLGRLLDIHYPRTDGVARALKIKLEVDTNPPLGASTETRYLDFPIHFAVTAHDLPSLMAGKSHALLCRKFVKGRDWFDFLWYVSQKTVPNFAFLSNALNQVGPWESKNVLVDMDWYKTHMSKKIEKIDWTKAKEDVQRFLKGNDVKTLELWSGEFFLAQLQKIT